MDYEWFKESISLYIDGELKDKENEKFEYHLKNFEECKKEYEKIKEIVDTLHELPTHSPSTPILFEIMDSVKNRKKLSLYSKRSKLQPVLYLFLLFIVFMFGYRMDRVSYNVVENQKYTNNLCEETITQKNNYHIESDSKLIQSKKKKIVNKIIPQLSKNSDSNYVNIDKNISRNNLELSENRNKKRINISENRSLNISHVKKKKLKEIIPIIKKEKKIAKFKKRDNSIINTQPILANQEVLGSRFNDKKYFLKRDEYMDTSLDVTLRFNKKYYNKIKDIISKRKFSYLESEINKNYEFLIHIKKKDWKKLKNIIKNDYLMKKIVNNELDNLYEIIEKGR